MSTPSRYLEQGQTMAPRPYDQRDAQGLGAPVRDTVHSRLDAAVGALARCESLAIALGEKLAGQQADARGSVEKSVPGVHALALDLHARAQRLEQILAAVNEVLA